jgi:hypothetical protein
MGVAEVAADTAAQALLPAVVAPQQLEGANARLVGAQTVANAFAGPALGGALAGIGVWLALGASGGCYAVAALGLALLRGTFRPQPGGERRRLGPRSPKACASWYATGCCAPWPWSCSS